MKLNFKFRALAGLTMALFTVILLSKCKEKVVVAKDCCQGYTGAISDSSAMNLKNKCHFISQDSIVAWTGRYKLYMKDSLPYIKTSDSLLNRASKFLHQSSISFDHCIIRTILCDENCIGLRVLYGMSANNKFHVILVGIDKDYNNLYVEGLQECCGGGKLKVEEVLNSGGGLFGGGTAGGAEYGQMP